MRRATLAATLICGSLAMSGCQPAAPPPTPTPVVPRVVQTPPAVTSAPPPKAPEAEPVRIYPASVTLLAGDPGVQMLIDNPSEAWGQRDMTSKAGFTQVEPPGIVEVDRDGYVRPLKPGTARLMSMRRDWYAEVTVDGDSRRKWSFAQDIEPILTRAGCNTGGCHGRGDGQNGFHLSLFGYDPEGDYQGLTRDVGERRLSKIRPESSLFLAKATGTIPHVGGPRIRPGSDEYRTLLDWLKAGTPYETPGNHGKLIRIAVEPGEVRLKAPGPQQLRVVAHYADGHRRDVTRLANYRTNDDSVLQVSGTGLAKILRRAEADLIVRYQSQVVSIRLSTLINPDLKYDFAKRARRNFIDDELFKRLESLKVPPSPPSSDSTFLRRVSLDLTGEQPSPDQVRDFLKNTDPDKRLKLVDELIASREFGQFWQIKLGDLLEITNARPELGNAAYTYQNWLKTQLLKNTPWDAMVRELLTALGDPGKRETSGAVAYALEGLDPKISAEKTAQRFLALRIRCAQCHDHPFDVWTQDDYFGLAATFAKVQRTGGGPGMMNRTVVKIEPKAQLEHLRTRKPAEPRILAGEPIKVAEAEDPRAKLAEWMTAPDNPFFARAMANWVWAQFFGKGIADPPDDLSRANPPVHPELLDALARHFVQHKYDLRDLIRTVAISEAYGMASTTLPGNEQDHRLFSHQEPRPLTAHQMADALAQATGVSNQFSGRDAKRHERAIEIMDPAVGSMILDTFGRCKRVNGCSAIANPSLSLRQSLMVIGGDVVNEKVSNPRGYLASLLELSPAPDEIVENLYLRTVCRAPTSEETTHWAAELGQAKSLPEAAEDLFWALLNSREFAFNH